MGSASQLRRQLTKRKRYYIARLRLSLDDDSAPMTRMRMKKILSAELLFNKFLG